jgi:hypothetical protein
MLSSEQKDDPPIGGRNLSHIVAMQPVTLNFKL